MKGILVKAMSLVLVLSMYILPVGLTKANHLPATLAAWLELFSELAHAESAALC